MRLKFFWGTECTADRDTAPWGPGSTSAVDHSSGEVLPCFCSSAGDVTPTFTVYGQGERHTCAAENIRTAEIKDVIDNMMSDAMAWLGSALLVDRIDGNLMPGTYQYDATARPYCGMSSANDVGVLLSADHRDNGIPEADFVAYVTAAKTDGSTTAWAHACMSSAGDHRPLFAHVNWGIDSGSGSRVSASDVPGSEQYDDFVTTAIHEMMHGMGFSDTFWDGRHGWFGCTTSGGCTSPVQEFTERGATVRKLTTPEVLLKIREWYNCPTLNGAEPEGGHSNLS
eukprot:gene56767-biopygen83625